MFRLILHDDAHGCDARRPLYGYVPHVRHGLHDRGPDVLFLKRR